MLSKERKHDEVVKAKRDEPSWKVIGIILSNWRVTDLISRELVTKFSENCPKIEKPRQHEIQEEQTHHFF